MGGDEDLPGSDLLALCDAAERELVLVAPFIKAWSLSRLLSAVSSQVAVTCVTRWRPDEVAAGVSDLEVLDEIEPRLGASLLLSPRLHGKYFRADDRCLVGSANLTGRALGWTNPPNIELLLPAPAAHPRLLEFEQSVMVSAHEATPELREVVQAAADQIRLQDPSHVSFIQASESLTGVSETTGIPGPHSDVFQVWLPRLRQPEDAYAAYEGTPDLLTSAAREAAFDDLTVLDPPPMLSRPLFDAWIGAALLQMPLIARIDRFVEQPRRFGAVRDLIATTTDVSSEEAATLWQSTMRWLLHFLPGRYVRRVPSHSEIFARVASADRP